MQQKINFEKIKKNKGLAVEVKQKRKKIDRSGRDMKRNYK